MNREDLNWAQRFVRTQAWRFAKTMPQWSHWYIVRGEGNKCADFDRLGRLVEKHGETDSWGKDERRYLRIGQHKYWVLGGIMNRAEPIPSAEVWRRGEAWLRRHHMKVGPYRKPIPTEQTSSRKERSMENRAYGDLRAIIERRGGSMQYQRAGYRYGAWIISLGGKTKIVEASGNSSFAELDRLYQTSNPNPRHWDDYDGPLVPDAEERLLSLLR